MSESLDQPATTAIATDDQAADGAALPPATAAAADIEALPGKSEPQAAPEANAAGLPVPVPRPALREPAQADGKVAEKSAPAGEASGAMESEAAPRPRAAASEAPLKFIPFRTLPPRQTTAKSTFGDVWFKVAAVVIALGIGWIAGANTFDRAKEVHSLALQLDATQARLAELAKAARIGPEPDLVALKRDFAALQKSVDGLGKNLDMQRAGLGTTKASVDSARSDLDSVKAALQTAQASLVAAKPDSAKLDRLAERLDRLESQFSALMPTGSIASTSSASAGAGQSASAAERDPHALPSKEQRAAVERPKIPPNGYVLRYVHDGVAIVEDRSGLHEVLPGEILAGVGRVESIERRGHRWVVVTSDGLIDSDPY